MHQYATVNLLKYGTKNIKYFLELSDLKEIIRKGENETVEFKLKANHPEKIVREMVAFANTNGGKLLIGIDDNGQMKGLKHLVDDEFLLVKAIDQLISPKLNYELYQSLLPDGREVLTFSIEAKQLKPLYVLENGKKICYIRVQDRSIQASKTVIALLKAEKQSINKAFTFGTKEKTLMAYLETNGQLSLEEFAKIAKIPLWLASKTLVTLCLNHVIRIIPGQTCDVFEAI
jgi:predicted HTH transcriptional regulator